MTLHTFSRAEILTCQIPALSQMKLNESRLVGERHNDGDEVIVLQFFPQSCRNPSRQADSSKSLCYWLAHSFINCMVLFSAASRYKEHQSDCFYTEDTVTFLVCLSVSGV